MPGIFGLGPQEIVILLVLAFLLVAGVVGVVFLVLTLGRNDKHPEE